jgi:hypothetical protein
MVESEALDDVATAIMADSVEAMMAKSLHECE